MAADVSAYDALGLFPDAEDAEIEQAYRRLIRQHHPDREGGDPARAAEINRAYREIRSERHFKEPVELHPEWTSEARRGGPWLIFALLLAVALLVLLLMQGPLSSLTESFAASNQPKPGTGLSKSSPSKAEPMDQPLDLPAINAAVREAARLVRISDEMGLARASRDCHHSLRTDPSLGKLDRCAAFDDAVVQLQDRDPLRDQGPFSELAVTGRIWGGATALSDDSVAIDGRLDRIRLRVEVALAPLIGERPAPANGN